MFFIYLFLRKSIANELSQYAALRPAALKTSLKLKGSYKSNKSWVISPQGK